MDEEKKAKVKAWLFYLLSMVESRKIVDAKLTESGDKLTVEIEFKRE